MTISIRSIGGVHLALHCVYVGVIVMCKFLFVDTLNVRNISLAEVSNHWQDISCMFLSFNLSSGNILVMFECVIVYIHL